MLPRQRARRRNSTRGRPRPSPVSGRGREPGLLPLLFDGGADLLISTMAERAKARAAQRLGEVSICVLDEQWPLTYLVVYGKARVERDLQQTGTVMMKVGEIMSGNPIPEAARPVVEEMARREGRVVVRVSPEFTFYTPPVHLNAGDDGSKMQHGHGQRLPWHTSS